MKTNLDNYEERFVDYMEGQLDAEEMHEVEVFVAQHPELEEDFKLFCASKLEPDLAVTFDKKESLMQRTPVVRPLYARIVAAAACVALLVGLGIRFLKPHQGFVAQPPLAELTPIEASSIATHQEPQSLRVSNLKALPVPVSTAVAASSNAALAATPVASSTTSTPSMLEVTTAPILTMEMPAIAYRPLPSTEAREDAENRMFVELGERLAALEPYGAPMDDPLAEPMAALKDPMAAMQDQWSGVRQTTRSLYKKTAKTVMDVYYTANYRLDEAKNQLAASR